MRVIAFGHRQRVGKDTAGKMILSHVRCNYKGVNVTRCSFGDKIKEVAYLMYRWAGLQEGIYYENHPKLKDAILPAIGKSPRQIWIEIGIAGQNIADQTWPEMAFQELDCDLAVVTDLRRPVEIKYVRRFNGIDIRIDRPTEKKVDDACDIQLSQFDEWSATIVNDSTLRDFNKKLISFFEEWWHGRVQPKAL